MKYSIFFPATIDPDLALDRGISNGIQNTTYGEDEKSEKTSLRVLHDMELKQLGIETDTNTS
jgi:hypothetical protein